MKTDTQIHNELSIQSHLLRALSEEESAALKNDLLSMFIGFSSICERYDLTYLLGGGSCLGAIRHQGFIPWDDDLDIMMPRPDYEQFIELCNNGILGEKYTAESPQRDTDCMTPYLKIFHNGTLNVELINESTPFHKGVFLDIFPIDNVSANPLRRFLHGIISDILQFISTCVLYAQYPSQKYLEFMNSSSSSYARYKMRLFIGKLFGIIPHRRWLYWFDKYNASVKHSGLMTIPTGRKHYAGEIQRQDVFFPTRYALFEGIRVHIPNDSDHYLKSLYGDYMTIPPIEKRERHLVYQFKCNCSDE